MNGLTYKQVVKKEWFIPPNSASYVLGWIPVGHIPTVQEVMGKLEYLRKNGESQAAFSFKSNYAKPD